MELRLTKTLLIRVAFALSVLINVFVALRWAYNRCVHAPNHYVAHRLSLFQSLGIPDEGVVVFGDSLTDQGEWAELLGNPVTVNRGINGAQIRDVTALVNTVPLSRARTAIVLVGVNDLIAGANNTEIARDFDALLKALTQQLPADRVIVQSLLPVNRARDTKLPHNDAIRQVNTVLAHMAATAGVRFVDVHARLADEEGSLAPASSFDGVHLNARGYAIVASVLRAQLGAAQ